MFHLDLLGASLIVGLIGLAAGVFYGIPLKRKIQRLDRLIAQHEAEAREEEARRPATRL